MWGVKSDITTQLFFFGVCVFLNTEHFSCLQLLRHLSLISPCGHHPLNESCDAFFSTTSSATPQMLHRGLHGSVNDPQAVLASQPPRGALRRRGLLSARALWVTLKSSECTVWWTKWTMQGEISSSFQVNQDTRHVSVQKNEFNWNFCIKKYQYPSFTAKKSHRWTERSP